MSHLVRTILRHSPRSFFGLLALLTLSSAAALADAQFGAPPPPSPPLAAGTPAPDFSTETLSGAPLAIHDLRGHVTVLDFWATWCVSCKQEMPELEKLQRSFASQGVRVIGVSLDTDNVDLVKPTVEKLGVTYTIAVDPRRNLAAERRYNANVLPCVYILDRHGIVRWSYSGTYDGEDKDMRAIVAKLIRTQ